MLGVMRRLTALERAIAILTQGGAREARLVDPFMCLPALRALWTMNSFNGVGTLVDMSGQDRTLTYNGNPQYGFAGYVPYIAFDGTGDYLSRADESGLDLSGAETIIVAAQRGLTIGGWFYFDNAAAAIESCLAKSDHSTQRSFELRRMNTGVPQFNVTSGGSVATVSTIAGADVIPASEWHFLVGRFTPSTEVMIYDNGTPATNTTSIIASVFNSTSALVVGGVSGGTSLMTGRATCCFLCATALSDGIIDSLYRRTAPFFV